MVSFSARFLIATISLIFPALAQELDYGNDQPFQPEARVNRTEVTLDLAAPLDMNMFEENLVQFKDFEILSISPRDSYIVLAVKDGEEVIYQCEKESNDYVYDVTLYNDGKEGCIIVFAEQGVSFFVKKDGAYEEIHDDEEMPTDLLDLLPFDYKDGEFAPLCGSHCLTGEENYGTLVSKTGNLSGCDMCMLL